MKTKKNILSLEEFQKVISLIEEQDKRGGSDLLKHALFLTLNKMFNIRDEDNIIGWWFEVKDKSDIYKTISVEGGRSFIIDTSEDLYNFLINFYV